MVLYFEQYTLLYFSSSPHKERSIPGHGVFTTRYPFVSGGRSLPFSSTTATLIPGICLVAEPGFSGSVSSPGTGEIIVPPVSVCHQVSTIGHFSFPITRKYHCHTSGFIGSPTVPSNLKLERFFEFGNKSPYFINIRSAVGVV